jgi:DNA-binding IclR family transcriptional regulator
MPPNYTAPALDKALDIMELLAETDGALSQSGIAETLGRSVGEIFRVLQTLERRGYLLRDPDSGLYSLSMRLFDLAHRHPPLRGLIQAASWPMRRLADEVSQSCNLAILEDHAVRVVAQIESPADFGFRVRVGARFPAGSTATGAVLLAFADERVRHEWLKSSASAEAHDGLDERMATAARTGHLELPDPRQPGIVDLVFPVIGPHDVAVAALTVPYISTTLSDVDAHTVVSRAEKAARELSGRLRGDPGSPVARSGSSDTRARSSDTRARSSVTRDRSTVAERERA